MTPPSVAVVLGAYNRLSLLTRAMDSLRLYGHGVDLCFYVVDGGSTDGTQDYLHAQRDVIAIDGDLSGAVRNFNLGFGAAVDAGHEFICHFNDDALALSEGMILRAVEALNADPKAGAVAWKFDLRGPFAHEFIHGKAYTNYGIIRREAGMQAARAMGDSTGRAWWNPIYRTYGADTELGCWLSRLGWKVLLSDDRVHDLNAQDELRKRNNGGGDERMRPRNDNRLFWSRWAAAETLEPGTPPPR